MQLFKEMGLKILNILYDPTKVYEESCVLAAQIFQEKTQIKLSENYLKNCYQSFYINEGFFR